eukprot:8352236-Pyramimonas_sp.AAC.1
MGSWALLHLELEAVLPQGASRTNAFPASPELQFGRRRPQFGSRLRISQSFCNPAATILDIQ